MIWDRYKPIGGEEIRSRGIAHDGVRAIFDMIRKYAASELEKLTAVQKWLNSEPLSAAELLLAADYMRDNKLDVSEPSEERPDKT